MKSDLKTKIETILISEVDKIYKKASSPLGLSIEDIRKLEVLVKIKDIENDDKDKGDRPVAGSLSVAELVRIAKGIVDDSGSNKTD